MIRLTIVCGLIIPLLFLSCASSRKTVYFQGIDTVKLENMARNYEVRIQTGDNLHITVSSQQPKAVEAYNRLDLSNSAVINPQTLAMTGYIVDNEGCIEFPGLGTVHLRGLTKTEAINTLREKLREYVIDPSVNIRFLNYKITVLGEVAKPGTYTIQDDRITLPEALGLAGDMTIYGMRKNVLICRQTDGVKSFHRIDMTTPEVFTSEFFYLQQNDVVYVQPNKARSGSAGYNQNLPLGVSILSLLVTIALLVF